MTNYIFVKSVNLNNKYIQMSERNNYPKEIHIFADYGGAY